VIDLSAIVLQVKNLAPFFGDRVYGAADLETAADFLDNDLAETPAALVIPLAEDVTDNEFDSCLVLEVTYRFGVLVALPPSEYTTLGTVGWDQVALAREALLRCLFGWTPEGKGSPIVYAGGELQILTQAVMAYRFDFDLVITITSENDGWQAGDLMNFSTAHVDSVADAGGEMVTTSDHIERNFD
jgi:hypothetical protein